MRAFHLLFFLTRIAFFLLLFTSTTKSQSFPIVDTGQKTCYDTLNQLTPPLPGDAFYGQDAQFNGNQPSYQDNGDGTVTDLVTGMMWQQKLFTKKLTFNEAVAGADTFSLAGYDDWRLPNAKELQSIVDYTRSPQTTNSAAIDPIFNTSTIIDEGGETNYPFYWTGTTHASSNGLGGFGVYVCFGEALGWMEEPPMSGNYVLMDVHGAGAQRSDPKNGNPANWPHGNGPQGDVVRIFNYVRLVRSDSSVGINENRIQENSLKIYPNPVKDILTITFSGESPNEVAIKIINTTGQVVLQKNILISSSYTFDVSGLPTGMYLLTLPMNTHQLIAKFFKQ